MSGDALPELEALERIAHAARGRVRVRDLCDVAAGRARHPIRALILGSPAPEAPAVGFFGGVHGLERIGSHVVLAFLESVVERLGRDAQLEELLGSTRLIFLPVVNPAGMVRGTRCNANGVDLMRNAPLEARERVAFLVGGQRVSPGLPWYRGPRGAPMEAESDALCRLVREELLSRPFSLALDCHSGFGLLDRIWFPHAHTRAPFERVAEVHALVDAFRRAHPERSYLFEPQSRRYLTHGDLWDYLCGESPDKVFIPLTLEMGSWRWVRKNPRQAFSRSGVFNPLPADRAARVRRNHAEWLQFLCSAAHRFREWLPTGETRERHRRLALRSWFGTGA